MANPGVGNKFTSVNLNKSYGQSNQSNTSSNYGMGRGSRPGAGGGASGGGGMVVLSRPRSAHKAGPKLSVPPPLNLPSLRKEHQKFDSLGSGGGVAGGGVAGSGARPSSSGLGWSKPSAIVGGEKEGDASGADRPLSSDGVDHGLQGADGVHRGGGGTAYMPPSARTDVSVTMSRGVEKASVLRGEDFPSLRATLSAANGSAQKQKDSAHQKHKQGISEEPSGGQREGSNLSSSVDMRPQVQSSHHSVSNGVGIHGREDRSSANSRPLEQWRKQDDFFPGPLPLVRLNPRSDWADDERDTSHGLTDRSRDHGFSRTEAYWDRDFDLPRNSLPPIKPAQNLYDRRGQRGNDVGKGLPNEVSNADLFGRDTRVASREGREGHSWRTSVSKDGFGSQDVINERNNHGARSTSVNKEMNKDNKYYPAQYGGNIRDEHNVGPNANRDYVSGRRDHVRHQWNNPSDFNNGRGSDRNTHNLYGNDLNRYKVDVVQNNTGLRPLFSPGNKGLSGTDHIGRDKRLSSRTEKPYVEDPFSSFDGQDPFPGSVLGAVKRKKDANKQLDFHDPVRESFEAELERVQKIQEQERQRIIEEQERALEMARREDEERRRVAREQEEHQRRLEEEAQEAAWRAEQERIEAIQRAEEQRIAREEEKQRLLMEEERRKHAAKQKLLELEEKIARRQAETAKSNNSAAIPGDIMPNVAKERDISRADDFACWEDGERMVERITNSASSDSSLSRPSDMGSRAGSAREGSFGFTDRGKPFNSWRRDMFENGNSSSFFSVDHENDHQSPRREASIGGRSFPRKELYSGQGYMPTRGYYRGGIPDSHMDDFSLTRGHRWNISGDGDQYARNMDLEADFPDVADRFDLGWGPGRGRGNSPFPERYYQNPDLDEFYTYGRSRYPARQPRVLPPPSLHSVHRTSFRGESEHPDTSAYDEENIQSNQALRSESAGVSYQIAQNEHVEVLDASDQSAKDGEQELNRSITPGRDSQSSLSVSSPPSSPTHLSHDDLDDSRESLALPGRTEGQNISLSDNEVVLSNANLVKGTMTTASSESVGDDEEWTVENNEGLQEQEEYDEDVGYHEEDEVHEGDDENVELNREFDDMHLEEKASHDMENLVLGFDQGVEVVLPNEDYEKSPRVDESLFAGSQTAVSIVEQKDSFDDSRDGLSSQAADVSQLVNTDGSCVMDQETEKSVEPTSTSMSLDSLNTGVSIPVTVSSSQQQSVSSSFGTNMISSNQALPNIAGTQGLADFSVKLQFGLFSGPSLIPSPVPAIQIGSIQMPLQLHPQMGPSLTHMHAPQPPLFQFGQLRYPSPISQGILPLAPQSMSFIQPNVPPIYSSSQVSGETSSVQPGQDSSHSSVKDDAMSLAMENHVRLPHQMNSHQDTESQKANLIATSSAGSNDLLSQNQEGASHTNQVRAELGQQMNNLGRPRNIVRNSKPLLSSRASVGPSSHSVGNIKGSSGPSAQSQNAGNRGRRFAFAARNSGARSSSSANEAYRLDSNGFQRKPRRGPQRFEFRVRQTADGKQSSSLSGLDTKSNSDGKGTDTLQSGLKKELPSDKPKETADSEISSSDQVIAQETGFRIEEDKTAQSESAVTSGQDTSQRVEGSLKRNISSEDDVDAPLQSGIVRVYKQSGIEAPSDEDDFIEVRSKRQMLNDRREQREKEIKAKSNNMRKAQRKSRPAVQGTPTSRSTSRTTASLNAQGTKSVRSAVLTKRGLLNNEVSATLNNVAPQTLAPIGTPPIGVDSQTDGKAQTTKPPQTSSYASSGRTVGPDVPDLAFDAQGKVADGVQSSLGSWSSPSISQPVMALTQTQLEEAMKPAHFDTHIISIGDRGSTVNDQGMPSSSVLVKDSPFSSATSPINSLLAGEKIQFGAVTSPTLLPPSTRGVSHNIRPAASLALDVQMSQSMPATQSNRDILFEKEKRPNESCPLLEDCEAEAEAAASAVAVAAIGNDEVVGNGIGSCSTAISDPKVFGGADVNGITTGMSGDQHAVGQSKAEETLSVSLPADLSVETPPMSIWPPLPSPHSSSSQVLSPFPGGPTSHFPIYDMNPMMGGPVFAFGPHEESAGPQSQQQKNSVTSSGPLGTWQQCHTGVDSFYGPPAGFTAPFISPSGSIPGVQGPPHMVVYNHFAPVGQFGQVGLSYMGTTYIPSGKQPDWKRNSASALGGNEGDMNSANMIPVQRGAPNVPAQVQHLAPGSPLLSMASPLAMFEVSPFQSSPDVSMHSRWSHVQPSIHTVPQSMPLQQQAEGAVPSQSTHGSAANHSLAASGFSQSQTSSSLEDGRPFAGVTSVAATQFPDELGLVDQDVSTGLHALALNVGGKNRLGDSLKVGAVAEGSGSKRSPTIAVSAPSKAHSAKQKNPVGQQQYNHYQRGGQKNGSGAEWPSRKTGFHGRNYSLGGDRNFIPPAKVKQIYVAKQSSTSSHSGTGSAV